MDDVFETFIRQCTDETVIAILDDPVKRQQVMVAVISILAGNQPGYLSDDIRLVATLIASYHTTQVNDGRPYCH